MNGKEVIIEFIHCISLVLDDSPLMDNDIMRRDLPSFHAHWDLIFGQNFHLIITYYIICKIPIILYNILADTNFGNCDHSTFYYIRNRRNQFRPHLRRQEFQCEALEFGGYEQYRKNLVQSSEILVSAGAAETSFGGYETTKTNTAATNNYTGLDICYQMFKIVQPLLYASRMQTRKPCMFTVREQAS